VLVNDDDVETTNEMTMFEKSTSTMSKYEMTTMKMWFECEAKTKMTTNWKTNISIDVVDDDDDSDDYDDDDGIEAMAIDNDDDNHVVDRTTIFVEVHRSFSGDVFYLNSDCLPTMNDDTSKSFSHLSAKSISKIVVRKQKIVSYS